DAVVAKAADDEVVQVATGTFFQLYTGIGIGVADQGHVGNYRLRTRAGVTATGVVVGFDTLVAAIGLEDHDVLQLAAPAEGPVQRVIAVATQVDVLAFGRAAEELHTIVKVVVYLDVVDQGATAY